MERCCAAIPIRYRPYKPLWMPWGIGRYSITFPGVYELEDTLHLANNVMIRGSGRGTKLIVLNDMGLLCQGCKGITVTDLHVMSGKVSNHTAGIVVDDCGDCQIRNVNVSGFAAYGIWVRNNSFLCELKSCKIAGNGKTNIYLVNLGQCGRGGDFVPNLESGCVTYGGNTGIECKGVIVLNIVGCVVFQPSRYTYYLHHTSNSVLISGCRSFQTG